MAQIYKERNELKYTLAHRYLLHPDATKISNVAPEKSDVKAKSVYVFNVFENTTERDPYWRIDGFQWDNRGSHNQPSRGIPIVSKKHFHLMSEGRHVDFHRYEFAVHGNKIKPPNQWDNPYVVVYYCGSFNPQRAINALHGNRKATPNKRDTAIYLELTGQSSPDKIAYAGQRDLSYQTPRRYENVNLNETYMDLDELMQTSNEVAGNVDKVISDSQDTIVLRPKPLKKLPKEMTDFRNTVEEQIKSDTVRSGNKVSGASTPHIRTDPSVKQNIANKLQAGKGATQTYRETSLEATVKHGLDKPTHAPRDRKQVDNMKEKIRATKENHDDIFEVNLFGKEHPDVVLKLDLLPSLLLIQVHPELSEHVKSFRKAFKNVVFHYDTTFDVGPFFTSILSVRHPLFKGEPIIPVAVMMHEKQDQKVHGVFFQTILENLDINDDAVVIVSDREGSIRLSINKYLNKAHNVFCWNHLKQNVGRWVLLNIPKEDNNTYQADVNSLLQSPTLDDYENMRAICFSKWSQKFVHYFSESLDAHILQSYRPVLESLGIYNSLSGITNNPAESSNAAFKKITSKKNATFFQASYALYFYQVSKMLEILRGSKNIGDFKMNFPKIPANVKLPKTITDVIDPNVIPTFVCDGQIPQDLITSDDYKHPSLWEMTTQRGIAEFLIAKNRIHHVAQSGVFIVTGLRAKQYMVNLETRTCSCVRKTICEHLLAVLKSTGTLKSKPVKRCQPNLGSVYRSAIKKTTGTKKGQSQRTRIVLPKSTAALIKSRITHPYSQLVEEEEVADFEAPDAQEEESGSDIESHADSLASNSHKNEIDHGNENIAGYEAVELNALKAGQKLPRLQSTNFNLPVLYFPFGTITLGELKSVDDMTNAEIRHLPKLYGRDFNVDTADWLVDSVINGFLLKITNQESSKALALTVSQGIVMFQEKEKSNAFSTDSSYDWENVDNVFIPYNVERCHWVLIVAQPKTRKILVMDPSVAFELPLDFAKTIEVLLNQILGNTAVDTWEVLYPQAAVSTGENVAQCGPFICFYAEAFVRNWTLATFPNIMSYRQHILSTLLEDCVISVQKRKKCLQCKKSVIKTTETCSFCKQPGHTNCMKTFVKTGQTFYFC